MVRAQTIGKKIGFLFAITAAVAVGGVTTALVSAAIPSGNGTIHGCYDDSGSLRVIDSAASCLNGETALNWSTGLLPVKPGDNLQATSLAYRDLKGANLSDTHLIGVDITGAKLNNVNLTNSRFQGVHGFRASMNNVDFTVTSFFESGQFQNSSFKNSDFHGMTLTNRIFSVSDFTGANFSGTTITGGGFPGSDFSGSDLSNASISLASFNGANMTTANVTNVAWDSVQCPDGTLSNDNGNTCEGHLTP
jgi:uncharacterized protein YjbI with pentapeptide repeats